MKKGKVWLVGAGPWDFELLTIKGKKVIENAQVIFYDRLVSHSIINLANENAILIDVGKNANKHTMPQEKINELLLEYALSGKDVVRLKGGDSFLFGRGGEEIELLVENDIPFEIVSGVTSPISVPAYNGIPVTHRDFTSSIHIIAGHTKSGILDIDFKSLVKLNGTLVFLMGVSSLNVICNGLLEAGMDKNMPVAILEKGTSAKQRNISGKLYNIYEITKTKKINTPAIIVVGRVCLLSEKFSWRNKLPLWNKRIIVTRPRDLSFKFCDMLREKGAEVIELPTIKTVKLENDEIKNTIECLNYKYVVFTSPKGAEIFFENMKKYRKDIRTLFDKKIAVIGNATKKVVEDKGLFVDIIPKNYCSQDLANMILENLNFDDSVLITRAKDGNKDIIEIFEKNKVKFKDLAFYETIYEEAKFINFEFSYDDIVTFTSASTVKGFVKSTKHMDLDYKNIVAICIGKQTEEEAKKYNFKTFVSNEATLESLVCKTINVCEGNLNE